MVHTEERATRRTSKETSNIRQQRAGNKYDLYLLCVDYTRMGLRHTGVGAALTLAALAAFFLASLSALVGLEDLAPLNQLITFETDSVEGRTRGTRTPAPRYRRLARPGIGYPSNVAASPQKGGVCAGLQRHHTPVLRVRSDPKVVLFICKATVSPPFTSIHTEVR